MTLTKNKNLQLMANAIRILTMDAVQSAKSGHPGLPMGAADIATVLFSKFLHINPKYPKWPDRDRFILSAGHGSMLQYAIHYLLGYKDMTINQIKNFRQLGSITAGHPEYGQAQGVETTTGPLGQGLANAVGMALAERMMNARFGDNIVNHYTYVLVGDGCLMEGISQESISIAGHLNLNRIIVLWDDNNITIDGHVNISDSTNQKIRFKSVGWDVLNCNGHNFLEIESAIETAKKNKKPTLIDCKTIIGFGSPNKEGTCNIHGEPLGDKEIINARKKLNWSSIPFKIPTNILNLWKLVNLKSYKIHKEWKKRYNLLDKKNKNEFDRLIRRDLPNGLDEKIQKYKKQLAKKQYNIATRKASQLTLEIINSVVPETIGGSADLAKSNLTNTNQNTDITAINYSGRFINYGIREHAMGAIMNGITLHGGFIPYSGTFFVFTDYLRPALRLGALMKIQTIYVMTHDSIGVGEDGPTHQPIEHLASVRCIPNINVFRPADATETTECWQLAIKDKFRPSIICLTRQNVKSIRLKYIEKNLCSYGAYEIYKYNEADVSIFASGSELNIAIEARKILINKKINSRIISVPSFELFNRQDKKYKNKILGNAKVNVAIEAALRIGWDQFIGTDGIFIGMNSFGASGSINDLYKHFNITVENLVNKIEKKLIQIKKTSTKK